MNCIQSCVPLLMVAELLMSPVMKDDSDCFRTVSFHIRRIRLWEREKKNRHAHKYTHTGTLESMFRSIRSAVLSISSYDCYFAHYPTKALHYCESSSGYKPRKRTEKAFRCIAESKQIVCGSRHAWYRHSFPDTVLIEGNGFYDTNIFRSLVLFHAVKARGNDPVVWRWMNTDETISPHRTYGTGF